MRLHIKQKFIAVLKGRLNMARLIEVYMEDGVVKGHIHENIYFEDTCDLISHMMKNYEIRETSEGYPFKDLVYGIGHEECVVALDASGNFFGVGEKGLLMILCDMPYHPYLLYETMDGEEIELV